MSKKILIFLCFIILIVIGVILMIISQNSDTGKTDGISKNDKNNIINNSQQNILIQDDIQQSITKEENEKVETIKIRVNDKELVVKLENNSSANALIEKLKDGNITINAHNYGDFEKVGNLGFNLPTNDIQIKTTIGDLMLYQGNQITLFYGSNSWSYTRLGKIVGTSEKELKNILGTGDVTLVLSID